MWTYADRDSQKTSIETGNQPSYREYSVQDDKKVRFLGTLAFLNLLYSVFIGQAYTFSMALSPYVLYSSCCLSKRKDSAEDSVSVSNDTKPG